MAERVLPWNHPLYRFPNMASTTLKLPEAIKARIAPLAHAAGMTPHAWMVNALATQTEHAERRAAFVQDALSAEDEVQRSGEVYRAEDVHHYLRNKLEGREAQTPLPVKV